MRKKLLYAAIVMVGLIEVAFVIFLIMSIYSINTKSSDQVVVAPLATQNAFATPMPAFTPSPTPTPTFVASGWIFQGFTGEFDHEGRYRYEWGTFKNINGKITKARCSAPNSPDPVIGAEYFWDTKINILVPVEDNSDGNTQRFWYPTILN